MRQNIRTRLSKLEHRLAPTDRDRSDDHLSILIAGHLVRLNPEYRLVTAADTDPVTHARLQALVAWADSDVERAAALDHFVAQAQASSSAGLTPHQIVAQVMAGDPAQDAANRDAVARAVKRLGIASSSAAR